MTSTLEGKTACLNLINMCTVEPLTKGQFGTAGFVLYREVFLPKRLTFLYQKIIQIIAITIDFGEDFGESFCEGNIIIIITRGR